VTDVQTDRTIYQGGTCIGESQIEYSILKETVHCQMLTYSVFVRKSVSAEQTGGLAAKTTTTDLDVPGRSNPLLAVMLEDTLRLLRSL